MVRYGLVHFKKGGEKGAKQQRMLTEQLNVQGIITIEKSKIEKWYEMDRAEAVGSIHRIALHDKNEIELFKTIMNSQAMQDENIEWKVTRRAGNSEYEKWVRAIEEKEMFDTCSEEALNGERENL